MAKKYKIEKGQPKQPDPDKMNKSQDFGKLVYNYEKAVKPLYKKPLYKDPKTFLMILLILLIIWLISSYGDEEMDDTPSNSHPIESAE
jgi:hypothetical protein